MTTTIEIGKGFDGAVCRNSESTLGHLTVGPERLLNWLESQLGLELPEVSFTSRMVQYLTCLHALDNPERFFHAEMGSGSLNRANKQRKSTYP